MLGHAGVFEQRRLRAVRLLNEGFSPVEVARQVGVDRRSVRRWAFFEVDAASIVIAVLKALADEKTIEPARVAQAIRKYGRDADAAPSWTR